jgi:hypothetical protein
MFNYYNLNKNSNFGFFKHSNDDYKCINLNKLSPSNPYIGYFSQYKKDNFFGISPNYKDTLVPYKKENSNRIIGSQTDFVKDKSNNLIQINNFVSLNHLLFGDKLFIPKNIITNNSPISETIINTDDSNLEIETKEDTKVKDSMIDSINDIFIKKLDLPKNLSSSEESLISFEAEQILDSIESEEYFNYTEIEDEYVFV